MELINLAPGIENHLSASSITEYTGCSHKWRLHYKERITFPIHSPSLFFGSAIHKTLEEFHKTSHIKKMSLKEIIESFKRKFDLEIFYGEVEWSTDKEKDKLIKLAGELLTDYYKVHQDDPPPLSFAPKEGEEVYCVELQFRVPIFTSDGKMRRDYCFLGFIDKIAIYPNNTIAIVDYKTSRYKYTDWKVSTDLQLVLYSYAFRYMLSKGFFPQLAGRTKEDYVSYDVLIKTLSKDAISKGELRLQSCQKIVTDNDINRLFNQANNVIKGIESKCFVANYENQWCAYCDYNTNMKDGIPICTHPDFNK